MKLGRTITAATLIAVVAVAGAQGKAGKAPGMILRPTKQMGMTNWQKMYDQAEKMFESKNAKAIFSTMTPDFTMTMDGQTMNLKQSRDGLAQWFGMVKSLHCDMRVTKVMEKGNTAVVTDRYDNWGMMKPDKKGHSAKFTDKGTETIHWVRMNGKWMIKKIVMNDSKMTMDGKPFKPGM